MNITFEDVVNTLQWRRPSRHGCISMRHPFLELQSEVLRSDPVAWQSLVPMQDDRGRTLLHHAAEFGVAPAIRCLVAAGADVNALDYLDNAPLHWAANGGHVAVVADLLSLGAKHDPVNLAGKTPLTITPARWYWSVATLLAVPAAIPHCDSALAQQIRR